MRIRSDTYKLKGTRWNLKIYSIERAKDSFYPIKTSATEIKVILCNNNYKMNCKIYSRIDLLPSILNLTSFEFSEFNALLSPRSVFTIASEPILMILRLCSSNIRMYALLVLNNNNKLIIFFSFSKNFFFLEHPGLLTDETFLIFYRKSYQWYQMSFLFEIVHSWSFWDMWVHTIECKQCYRYLI